MKLFLQKNAKVSSAGGSAPRPPCLRRLGALPPHPQPPAAWGFALRPHWPPAAGGSTPRPPKQPPPIANFWLGAWPRLDEFGMQQQSGEYFAPNPVLSFFGMDFALKFGGED